LKKLFGLDHFEGGRAFNIVELGMGPKKIFDPTGGHGQNGKSFCFVKLDIANGERQSKFWI